MELIIACWVIIGLLGLVATVAGVELILTTRRMLRELDSYRTKSRKWR